MSQISELTPQLEALIPIYREKWRQIVLSTQPINHVQAATAVEELYAALGKPKPEVYFFQSPLALKQVCEKYSLSTSRQVFGLPIDFMLPVAEKVIDVLTKQFETKLWYRLEFELALPLEITTLRQATSINMFMQQLPEQLLAELPQELLSIYWEYQQYTWRQELQQQPTGKFVVNIGVKDRTINSLTY